MPPTPYFVTGINHDFGLNSLRLGGLWRCKNHPLLSNSKNLGTKFAKFPSEVDYGGVSHWVITDAVLIAVRSDFMFAAATAAVAGVYAVGATINRKAMEPALPWRKAVVGGAQDEVRVMGNSIRHPWKTTTPDQRAGQDENRPVHKARLAVTLVTVSVLGLAGALALTLSGHPPTPIMSMAPVIIAASLAIVVALQISQQLITRSILISRSARLIASSLFVEVSAATAMVVAVSVVVHTAGLTAISLVEVVAITLATRLAVVLTPWPGGLVIADAVFLIPLIWIGVPFHVGLAAVLIWRAGSLLAVSAALVTAAFTEFLPSRSRETFEGESGRLAHRALFRFLSVMPIGIRDVIRSKVFDSMFSLSDDPWGYQQSAYEHRKRQSLVSAVSEESRLIVEVGCADGHNVVALAEQFPKATIIGLDVSAAAVAIATRRTQKLANVQVLNVRNVSQFETHPQGNIDCVILAEVLYYLGTERAIREALHPLRSRMSPDCRVILLHGSSDADSLHDRAVRALNLSIESNQLVEDSERPFVITVAS